MTLLVHFLAGGLGLVFGNVALSAAKGAPLHRNSGMLFVYAMLTTSVFGRWRVRIRRTVRGIVGDSSHEVV